MKEEKHRSERGRQAELQFQRLNHVKWRERERHIKFWSVRYG